MVDYGDFDEPWDDDYSFALRQGNRSLGSFAPGNLTSTITTKVPPMFDGSQSWFAYEKAIDEWVDLTELAEEKQGPALKARLEGDAARFKEFLDRDLLKQKNGRGIAYFKETLRARFLKSTQVVFLWRFLKFFEMPRLLRNSRNLGAMFLNPTPRTLPSSLQQNCLALAADRPQPDRDLHKPDEGRNQNRRLRRKLLQSPQPQTQHGQV
jgi:hypothetical protein